MVSSNGPRRLVLRNIEKQVPGSLKAIPNSTPPVQPGTTYTANFQQSITYPGANQNLASQKQFRVSGSPYALDPSLIDSVYPPPGHSDYWNVLPHVLFKNQQVPWRFQVADADNTIPWLALIVFTEAELTLSSDQENAINKIKALDPTPTFANNLAVSDLAQLNAIVSQPIPLASAADSTPIQVIFIQSILYSSLFGHYDGAKGNSARVNQSIVTPDLTRYKFMSHVRSFNTDQLANRGGNGESRISATISPRTGPLNLSRPSIVYAHLVSLNGLLNGDVNNMNLGQNKPTALVSLHSWSFTYLPTTSFSVANTLASLGQSLQPLRTPDISLITVSKSKTSQTQADSWVKSRTLAGYTLTRYRTPTGEPTIALQRGLLTPIKYEIVDFPPSDYGTNLAIIDESTGFLDLTFQLAWELGRVSAIADRAVSAALMRLRKDIHTKTLGDAKKSLDNTFVSGPTVLQNFATTNSAVTTRLASNSSFLPRRWQAPDLGVGHRTALSFQNPPVRAKYSASLRNGIGAFANTAPASKLSGPLGPGSNNGIFNEEGGSPNSSDYATILEWAMDRWFLQGIPFPNIVPDPAFIPKESIRSFYVDQSWFKVFIDGALSIAEHFDEGDDVRESIKTSLTTYLNTPLQTTTFAPQIPKWGFFIRSALVTKFPDLRISAPFKSLDSGKVGKQAEVLRKVAFDVDLLCVLFDREPGDFDLNQGIVLQPPEHQLTSMLCGLEGIQSDTNGNPTMTVHWKKVWKDLSGGLDAASYNDTLAPLSFKVTDRDNGLYDSTCQSLIPKLFADMWPVNDPNNEPGNSPGITPAMVGSQLMAVVPKLVLKNVAPAGLQLTSATGSSLSTNKGRSYLSRGPAPKNPLLSLPSPLLQRLVLLPTPRSPVNPMIAAIGKTDLPSSTDDTIIQQFLFPDPQSSSAPTTNRFLTSTGQGTQTFMSTPIFNIQYRFLPNQQPQIPFMKTALVAPVPLSLDFKTDLHIPMTSLATSPSPLLSVNIKFTVGPSNATSLAFLNSFPSNLSPSTPIRDPAGEYPSQPDYKSRVLPKVRVVGIGQRWKVRTSYDLGTLADTFTVTIYPNGPDTLDVSQYPDLGIVIEKVQLNYWNDGSGSQVWHIPVEEIYVLGNMVTIESVVDITVRGVDITKSTLMFA